MTKHLAVLSSLLLALVLMGCGKGENPSPTGTAATSEENAVALDGSAHQAVALPVTAASAPDAVVAAFLDALREGNEDVAEALLTSTAQTETSKHDLQVRPPGTPSATYQIGNTQAVQGGAHVESIWSETLADGYHASYNVIWVLKQQSHGWRVAGMATTLVPGQPPVFLNFEDPADMFKKAEQAEAAVAAEIEQPAAQSANAAATSNAQ